MIEIIISIGAILLVVIIGYKAKLNMGLLAILFSYIIGAFFLNMPTKEVLQLWPISLFLMLFSVTLFYSFAALNGTLEAVAKNVVYKARKAPWSMPIVLFVLGFVMSGIGAGDSALVALIPIGMTIAVITNMNYLLATVSCVAGINIGSFSPIAAIGIFCRQLTAQVGGYSDEIANSIGNRMMLQSGAIFTISFILAYIIFKGYKITVPVMDKPDVLTKVQKKNVILIICFVGILLLVPAVSRIFPSFSFFVFLRGKLELAFIAFIFSGIAMFMKLADEKEAFRKVPLQAITIIAGMGMLVGILSKLGALDMMANYLSGSFSSGLTVQILLGVFGGIMSLFVAGYIVNTAFFPLVPALALGLAWNPGMMFAAVAIGAIATAVSPFSQIGGFTVSSITDEDVRKKVFGFLLIWPFINLAIYVGLMVLGL